jgi:hypothetical protein
MEIRAYKKRELAALYYPHTASTTTAVKNLKRAVDRCPHLTNRLRQMGWNRHLHSYTAQQVATIVDYLCEP